MTKMQFILSLNEKLSGLPKKEIEERLLFYSEMIEDRMEDGLSEEEAVAGIGHIDEIASRIRSELFPDPIAIPTKRHPNAGLVLLLILGSPLWIALLAALFSVVFALYAVLWSVVISFWAVELSFICVAIASLPIGVFYLTSGIIPQGLLFIAACLVFAGLSVILFYGCKALTKGSTWLTKITALGIRNIFRKKEKIQ